MRKGIVAGIIVFALGFLVFSFVKTDEPEIVNRNSEGSSVVAFGDSLVEGVGASLGNDFPSVLSRSVGEEVVNLGVSGNTTTDGLRRIDEALEFDPKVVIVLLGGNDAIRRVSVAKTFQNLRSIVERIQEKGAAVVHVGVQSSFFGDQYKEYFEALSKEMGTALVPDILDGIIGKSQYMSDPIHPNDEGYAIIAERIEPVLRDILRK